MVGITVVVCVIVVVVVVILRRDISIVRNITEFYGV